MSTCKNPKYQWVEGFKKMAVGDFLPGSIDGLVTYEMLEKLKAGLLGEEKRSLIRAGQYLKLDCGGCSSCHFKAVMAKTGAMLNETVYAGDVCFLSMTYRNDEGSDTRADMAHKVLTPSHIRTLRERMRRDSHYGKFRSLIVGEYGDLKGRAHFHAILWSDEGEPLPEFPYDEPFQFKHWDHGHCFARAHPGQAQFQYVAGYALKSLLGSTSGGAWSAPSQLYMSASRRPVLGHRMFAELGARAAEYGVPPSFNYLPPGGDRKYNYTMKDRSRDLYIDAYLDALAEFRPDDPTFSALSLPLMQAPKGTAFRGVAVNGGPDVWMQKAVMQGLVRRQEWFADVDPAETVQADMADLEAALADRQLRQERLNAVEAERRAAAAVKAANERNRLYEMSMRSDPSDPYWDEVDARRFASKLLKGGAWQYD